MKIYLTGAQNVGKSTLARALAEKLGLPLVPESARDVFRVWDTDADYSIFSQAQRIEIQQAIWEKHCENCRAAGDSFVADRSVVDVLAYSRYWGLDRYEPAREFLETLEGELAALDGLLIYVPPHGGPLEEDGIRMGGVQHQRTIDLLIRGTVLDVTDGKYDFHWLFNTSAEDRLVEAFRFCNRPRPVRRSFVPHSARGRVVVAL